MRRAVAALTLTMLLVALGSGPLAAAELPSRPSSTTPRRAPGAPAFTPRELCELYEAIPAPERERVEGALRAALAPAVQRARARASAGPTPVPGWNGRIAVRPGGALTGAARPAFEQATPRSDRASLAFAGNDGDDDGDGLPESFENQLADLFTPLYFISADEHSGTGFARFGDFVPQTPVEVLPPVPPISHFRVKPLGFTSDASGQQYGVIQVDYLTLWNRDDGLRVGGDCRALAAIVGGVLGLDMSFLLDRLKSHRLDNERSAVLLAAPSAGFVYNSDPAAYSLHSFYTAAHEGEPLFDHSAFGFPAEPVPAGNHLLLAASQSKHATYSFDPGHFPLFPAILIVDAFATLDLLYFSGQISFETYLYLNAVFSTVFYSCIVEHFDNQGGAYAVTRINVGEPGRPLNGSGFIEDAELHEKLTVPLWIVQ